MSGDLPPWRRTTSAAKRTRSPIFYRARPVLHLAVTGVGGTLASIADVFVVVGIIAFVLALMGLSTLKLR